MNENQVGEFYIWFNKYFESFKYDNEKIISNLINKKLHTLRVCENIKLLSQSLNLSSSDSRIAEVIALFHDIGRFEQFAKYQTFKDDISIDHASLGLSILNDYKVLKDVSVEDTAFILQAIGYHNKYAIPTNLPEKNLLFCKLIRDADKLDIFNMLIDSYENHQLYKNEAFEEFIDSNEYQISFVERIINREKVSFNEVKTKADIKILRLSWIYDINFNESLKIIESNKYIDRIIKFLPRDENIVRLHKHINAYVQDRMNNLK